MLRTAWKNKLVLSHVILITTWGILSTRAVTVFILSKDPDSDHSAMIKITIGLISRQEARERRIAEA